MEKYGQFRDKGSGIAPFFPIPSPRSSPFLIPYHAFLFFFRLPFLLFAWAVWLFIIQWTPAGSLLRKANLWCILGIPGVWWVEIRVDGVQRGSLARSGRLPGPGDVIAASCTSPLDILYLAAIFDPIFTQSYQGTRSVRALSLEGALAACFRISTTPDEQVTDLARLAAQNPGRIIVVFPEGTTSNGRGILRLTPSLLGAGARSKVFPVSIRYAPADVVTPIPGPAEALRFVWTLCSRQTHTLHVRVGLEMNMPMQLQTAAQEVAREARGSPKPANGYDTNFFDSLRESSIEEQKGEVERRALDMVAGSLSRLGKSKTLGLGVEDKARFIAAWSGSTRGQRRSPRNA